MSLIPGLGLVSSALQAEKIRLECTLQNIVNAQTTKGPDGKAYQKQSPVFESVLDKNLDKNGLQAVKVSKILKDDSQGEKIYRPGHPHADEKGMVEMPNVKMPEEMVNMISSSRCFEAVLGAANIAESLARKTLSIGK
jgi:flagellar basal-body rod protein FlgC